MIDTTATLTDGTPSTPQMIVGSAGNLGLYASTGTHDLGLVRGWTIKSLALDPQGVLWCVGTEGNPAKWDQVAMQWVGAPDWLGGWSLNCLAWDPSNTLWCVGSAGNLSRWDGDWQTNSGGWAAGNECPQFTNTTPWSMVTFDAAGTMWGVQTDGTIVYWSPSENDWQGVATSPPAPTLMVSFSDAMYAVTTDFRTFSSLNTINPSGWELVPTGWTVRWFGPAGNPFGLTIP
jgi:hypothetical protein